MGIVTTLLVLHFIADFILQSDKVAIAKSKSGSVLLYHVSIYTLTFAPFAYAALPRFDMAVAWLALNFAAHYFTDYISSRLTTRLYAAGERHWFFVVIGADQLAHYLVLIWSFTWLANR